MQRGALPGTASGATLTQAVKRLSNFPVTWTDVHSPKVGTLNDSGVALWATPEYLVLGNCRSLAGELRCHGACAASERERERPAGGVASGLVGDPRDHPVRSAPQLGAADRQGERRAAVGLRAGTHVATVQVERNPGDALTGHARRVGARRDASGRTA